MARKTREEHEAERQLAVQLISSGQVSNWAELGAVFAISPQAANARFGRTYRLVIPRPARQFRRMVSVSLHKEMDQRLEAARLAAGPGVDGVSRSRAEIVRDILDRELPKLPQEAA